MRWIRFPNAKEHERAIGILLEVPGEYIGLPGPTFVMRDEHIKALEQGKVRFEYLSGTRRDGKKSARVRR